MSKRPRESGDTAKVVFTYESAYNAIVEPNRYVSLSHYFVAHWMPHITPNGLRILIQLRAMGYYNPKDGVQRGEKDIDQKELAALCGMSHSTLKRAFTDDEVLNKYVQRVFRVERDRYGRIVREHYVYVVKMDDVLTPEDAARLEVMREGPDKGQPPPRDQNEPSEAAPRGQNDPRGVQNGLPMAQNEPPEGQNDPSLNGSLNTPHTLNTLDTPAAPGDSLSLFEEGIKGNIEREQPEEPEPTWKVAYNTLPDAERKAWTARASAEAHSHGVKPSNIPEVVKIARALFRDEFEKKARADKAENRKEG